jgi:hypothetical protein
MDIIENARKRLKEDVLEIENRTDLTPDQKSEKIIKIFSAICAAVAVQPIPFAFLDALLSIPMIGQITAVALLSNFLVSILTDR